MPQIPRFVPPAKQRVYDLDEAKLGFKVNVLLVEDDEDFAITAKEFLETYDYAVTIAKDGVEGMKLILNKDFDIILCDLLMPNLPGDMFYLGVERIKPRLCNRFIFITGHQGNPRIQEFMKKVRALSLYKPFEMHTLLEAMDIIRKRVAKGE